MVWHHGQAPARNSFQLWRFRWPARVYALFRPWSEDRLPIVQEPACTNDLWKDSALRAFLSGVGGRRAKANRVD
jgi:hypothetical protein